MRMISREALQALRERFPKGTRVELVKMDDPQAPPVGTNAKRLISMRKPSKPGL